MVAWLPVLEQDITEEGTCGRGKLLTSPQEEMVGNNRISSQTLPPFPQLPQMMPPSVE